MISLKDKVTLVTGGSRGIGRAIVHAAARAGSHVVVNYVGAKDEAESSAAAAEAEGVQSLVVQADVANKAEVDRMMANVIERFGRIDVLVNNAGVWKKNPIADMSLELLHETININLLGTFYTIMAAVPHMISRKSGSIINISSTAGQRGEADHSPYAASKSGVIGITKSLARELVDHNIRVNCVAPGWAVSDMTRPHLAGEEGARHLGKIPMGRAADPEEIAWPVIFLASDRATFVTGEVFNVNGGAVLCA